MADFGGLASVLQMQNQGLMTQTKQTKQQARKRSLADNTEEAAGNARVNSKLLQLLKENQDDFRLINGSNGALSTDQQAQMQQDIDQQGYIYDENYVIINIIYLISSLDFHLFFDMKLWNEIDFFDQKFD